MSDYGWYFLILATPFNFFICGVMTYSAWAPMSRGVTTEGLRNSAYITCILPVWLACLIVTLLGGILPFVFSLVAYGICFGIAYKKEMWGCQYANKEATAEEYA